MPDLMNTHEVAEYLRIKQRKVYDLVRKQAIPCTKSAGKWLFPKHLIDIWLAEGVTAPPGDGSGLAAMLTAPPLIAGSHDPLLDWALLESACGLAMLPGGSTDGLKRFVAGEALACGMHLFDSATGTYNVSALQQHCPAAGRGELVLIEWVRRSQGLIVAPGNPKGISGIADLVTGKARVMVRQPGAGSFVLFQHLTEKAGFDPWDMNILDEHAKNESELGLAIRDRKADAGLGVAAVAAQFQLDFVPLASERYDLLLRRRDYFEEPFQRLLRLGRTEAYKARARDMKGYDVSGQGTVHYNG
ncbi:MAG: substrate-binding domain-containing protein [Alphaproteobacteria bacterium]